MVIDKKTREEWRELAQMGMRSALGEYTPVDEFVALLDYIDELEAQLTMRAPDLPKAGGSISVTCPNCGTFIGVDFGKSASG